MDNSSSYIIKLVNGCNLACSYCDYLGGTPRAPDTRLSISLLRRFLDEASQRARAVELIWHGGEPLAVGVETFREILEVQNALSKQRKTLFRNRLQTNGTLINRKWIEVFRKGNIGLGLSLDGPRWLHDKWRRSQSQAGSHKQVARAIDLLQKESIPFSVLAVVTSPSLGHEREIFEYFVQLGVKRIDFLPCINAVEPKGGGIKHEVTRESLRPGDFAGFMTRMFDLWLQNGNPAFSIRYLDNVLVGLLGGRPHSCKFNGRCGHYVTLDYNGTVMPCDGFVRYDELRFGDLREESLDRILDSSARRAFRSAVGNRRPECRACQYLRACGGGCTKHSYMWKRDFQEENYLCLDIQRVFAHVTERIRPLCPDLMQPADALHPDARGVNPGSKTVLGGQGRSALLSKYPSAYDYRASKSFVAPSIRPDHPHGLTSNASLLPAYSSPSSFALMRQFPARLSSLENGTIQCLSVDRDGWDDWDNWDRIPD